MHVRRLGAYDERAVGTQLRGALRRPANERTEANKERAISHAVYQALADVLPVDTESVYKLLMWQLGYDPNDNSTDIETPAGIGNVACGAETSHCSLHVRSYPVNLMTSGVDLYRAFVFDYPTNAEYFAP